jgi:hypothetical protein
MLGWRNDSRNLSEAAEVNGDRGVLLVVSPSCSVYFRKRSALRRAHCGHYRLAGI